MLGLSETQIQELLDSPQKISDLLLSTDTAWVYADLYEYEAEFVRPGQKARITAQALPYLPEITVALLTPIAVTGTVRLVVVPSPKLPQRLLRPTHLTVPSESKKQVLVAATK